MGRKKSIIGKTTNKFLTDSDINHLYELLKAEKLGNNVYKLLKQQDEDLLEEIKNINEGLKGERDFNKILLNAKHSKKKTYQSATF